MAITARPPTTPPTIGPVSLCFAAVQLLAKLKKKRLLKKKAYVEEWVTAR
jgi:hypothetical protein